MTVHSLLRMNKQLSTTHEQWKEDALLPGGSMGNVAKNQRADFCLHEAPQTVDDLPTVYELEYFMRQSKCDKAMGYDVVPGELLHYAAPYLASKVWPVMAKMSMWVDEPPQWKGGRLITAFKNKGSVQECSNYRALLVSSSLQKAMRNIWRRRVYPYVQSGASPLQFSAQHRALVTQASHCARFFASSRTK